jgi:hypothetical protein
MKESGMRAVTFLVAVVLALSATRVEAGTSDRLRDELRDGFKAAEAASWEFLGWAEKAIIAGASVIYQNRHTVSGAVIGCAAGATLGATSGVAAGLSTGGAAFAVTPEATVLGCGLGAAAGAALGYPMDHATIE